MRDAGPTVSTSPTAWPSEAREGVARLPGTRDGATRATVAGTATAAGPASCVDRRALALTHGPVPDGSSTGHDRGWWSLPLMGFVAALAVRVGFCFVLAPALGLPLAGRDPSFFTSTDGYVDLAVNWAEHGRLAFAADAAPALHRAPAYPVLLGLFCRVTGDIVPAVLWLNCVASAVGVALGGLVAARVLHVRHWWLIVPGALLPTSVYYSSISFSDTFYATTVALFLVSLLWMLDRPTWGRGMLHGAAYGLSVLTKPMLLPVIAVVGLWVLLRRRDAWRGFAATCTVGLVVVGAWTARNYVASGRLVPVATGGGFNLLAGNYMIEGHHDSCDGAFFHSVDRVREAMNAAEPGAWPRGSLRPAGHWDVPPKADALCTRLAKEQYLAEPWLLPKKIAINFVRFWYFSSTPGRGALVGLTHAALLVLAGVAMVRAWRRDRAAITLVLLVLGSFILLYCGLIVHSTRFALPVTMVLAALAGDTLRRVFARAIRAPSASAGFEHR